jgi:predicted phosphodiesterase
MANDYKWLMASDIHFPLHDPRKVELFIKVMKWFKPDALDYLGDIDDADSTGRWAVGPETMVSVLDGGVKLTTELFAQSRDILPNADIHMHDGNHGWDRHAKYLLKNAPVMLDVINSDSLYQYSKYGVQWHEYSQPPVHRFGDMYGHHGESTSKHAGESVRNDVQNWDVSLVRGHSHRMGAWYQTFPISGRMLRGYEIGHLCDEKKMDYIAAPNWQAGFAIAHVVNDFPHMQLIQINDYTCVVDGKVFKN